MSLDYRSWGETKNCHGCRYWSERLAMSDGNGLRAMCISADSPNKSKWMPKRGTCEKWDEGSMGAVDSPGGEPYEDDNPSAPRAEEN
jgi:hypothetical protein